MNIAVVGSRNFNDYELLKSSVEEFVVEKTPEHITVISGGAKGADSLAEKLASEKNYDTLIFNPDYKKYGRSAPLIRNTLIIENADVVFAFWDGISRGTKDSISKAEKLNKEVRIRRF